MFGIYDDEETSIAGFANIHEAIFLVRMCIIHNGK